MISLPVVLVFLLYLPSSHDWIAAQRANKASAASQNKRTEMSDRAKAGLRGPVMQCVEQWTMLAAYGQPEHEFASTTEYDPSGRTLSRLTKNPDGSELVMRYVYDEQHRLVKTTYGKLGEAMSEQTYSYDERGRLTGIGAGHGSEGVRYEYDAEGRKTKIEPFAPLPPNTGRAWTWEGSEVSVAMPDNGTLTTLYNEQDQPTEAQVHDPQGRLVQRILRTYDEQGRMLGDRQEPVNLGVALPQELQSHLNEAQQKAIGAFFGKMLLSGGSSFRYDDRGRLIEKRRSAGESSETITAYSYNEHDDPIEERTTTLESPQVRIEYSIDEEGNLIPTTEPVASPPTTHVVRYSYQYDVVGNWTEKITNNRNGTDVAFTTSAIYRRKIAYY
jgi:YD repeat-containing protein